MDNNVNDVTDIINAWDCLYRRLKTFDESAQQFHHEKSKYKIKDAILGYLASFGLSMLKDLYFENNNSVGFLLSLRCILEGLSVFMYLESITLTEEQEKIFELQSFFIEKKIYEKYPELDGLLFDLRSILENFDNAKQFLIETYDYTSKQVDSLLRTKLPFIKNISSFEALIRDHLDDDFLILYKTISLYVHPYDYRLHNKEEFTNFSIFAYTVLDITFQDIPLAKNGLEYEYNRVIAYNEFGLITRDITTKQKNKINKICSMLDGNGYNFLAFSLHTCSKILFDYLLDTAFGYTEQSTTKWKTSIESLCMLKLCINDENMSKDNEILWYHSRIMQMINANTKPTDEDFEPAYEIYKARRINPCSFEIFKKNFTKTTGYTIDENGKVRNLKSVVFDLIDEFSNDINSGILDALVMESPFIARQYNYIENMRKIDINSYLKMKYDESQVMSHASGYLYYCTSGAWYDGTILACIYDELLQLILQEMHKSMLIYYKEGRISKTITNYLRNFLKDNREYIIRKKQIYLIPKVRKDY